MQVGGRLRAPYRAVGQTSFALTSKCGATLVSSEASAVQQLAGVDLWFIMKVLLHSGKEV